MKEYPAPTNKILDMRKGDLDKIDKNWFQFSYSDSLTGEDRGREATQTLET